MKRCAAPLITAILTLTRINLPLIGFTRIGLKLISLAMLTVAIISVEPDTAAAADNAPVVITDMAGREVMVPYNPKRIICIGPGALRLIVYLQCQNRVVGVEDMEKMSPGGRPYWLANLHLAELPRVGPGGPASINKKPDLEAILTINPDVVFMTQADVQLLDTIQKQINIPFVALSYGEFATFDERIYDSLRLAGKIMASDARAESVIDYIESARKELQKRTSDIEENEKPSVYVGGIGMRGAQGIGSSEKHYIPLKWAGAKNIAQNQPSTEGSHVFLDKEKLLSLDPDFIFIDGGGVKMVEQDFSKKPQYYMALSAFNKKRVYRLLPFNFYTTNVETALADAYAIGKIIYPEKFSDIDPEKRCDEIYSFMVGKPVYCEMKKEFGQIGAPYSLK